jgi:predicted metal-binding protein
MTGYVTNEPQNNGANMSQNRCGYCWNYGHNRTTCPKMKEDYEEASKAVEEGTSTRHLTWKLRRALNEYPEVQRRKKNGQAM